MKVLIWLWGFGMAVCWQTLALRTDALQTSGLANDPWDDR